MKELQKYIEMNVFNEEQLEEIELGLKDNLDVSLYAKKEFNDWQMYEIREGMLKGLDISVYANSDFDNIEMSYIKETLEKGFNPKDLIGKVEFELLPLFADLNNLGLNINDYLDKNKKFLKNVINELTDKKIEKIVKSKGYELEEINNHFVDFLRDCVLEKIDISPYAFKEFDSFQLKEIKEGLKQDLDVSLYAKEEFTYSQMHTIKVGLKNNLNAGLYAYKEFSDKQMNVIRIALEKGTFKRSDYFDTKIIDSKITYIPKNF